VLQSTILNFNLDWDTNYLTSGIGGGDWAYVLYFPTYAATAWYHHAIERRGDLPSFLASVQHFAMTDYLLALSEGDMLSPQARADVVRRMHEYTGLSEAYIRAANLRVTPDRFMQVLLRSRGEIVGGLDSRYVNDTPDATGGEPLWDPLETAIFGPYTTAINDYLRFTLGYNPPIPYKTFTDVPGGWDWKHLGQPNTNVAVDLAMAMDMNPSLKIFSANGYFDFATPYMATIYTLHHLGVKPALQRNITFGFYETGHMLYLNPPVFAQYKRDLDRWYGTLR
jgi:carboxypeptidase C (cathepsin A)